MLKNKNINLYYHQPKIKEMQSPESVNPDNSNSIVV